MKGSDLERRLAAPKEKFGDLEQEPSVYPRLFLLVEYAAKYNGLTQKDINDFYARKRKKKERKKCKG